MKEKHKKKTFAVSAFLLIFSGIILFGYYRFIPTKEVTVNPTDSLNTKLPPIQQPVRQLTKMEIYLQAEKDSLAKQQQRSRDPYATGNKEIIASMRHPSQAEQRINRLYADLDKAVSAKKEEEDKIGSANKTKGDLGIGRMTEPVQVQSSSPVLQSDPDLQQLASMLDKLTELQNPSRPVKLKKMDSLITVKAVDDKTIQAVVHQDQVIRDGGILKLRLCQDIMVNGNLVPRGSFVYGVCHLTEERLLVQLTSITCHNQVLPFPLTVYDLDGIEGIYIPGALARETGKQGADNALQSLQLSGMDAGLAAQAAGAGLQTARNLFSRKLRTLRVTAKAGHRVFLQKNASFSQLTAQ